MNIIPHLTLPRTFDLLLLVTPRIQVLDDLSAHFQTHNFSSINISKELSQSLISVPAYNRGRFSQNWCINTLSAFQKAPIICGFPDLLFDPSLEIDPLELFRQVARIIKIIVLWPGEYIENSLSYAVPGHHHYRAWTLANPFLRQPLLKIVRISSTEGE